MEQRIFHGDISPRDLANVLVGEFNRGNLRALHVGSERESIVQISTRDRPRSGGQTSITITIRAVEDGVAVQIGEQAWLGVAASLGQTALTTIHDPWSLLGRLDDLAQDIENLQLSDQVWSVVESSAQALGFTFELSERLRRLVCAYCLTANPVGEGNCISCGAPLGEYQPRTCLNCGFVVKKDEITCPNCNAKL